VTNYIGQTVHYLSYGTPGGEFGQECRAAIITAIDDSKTETVSLAVLNPTGIFLNSGIRVDLELSAGGTWHYTHMPLA
jgi:hypothetical protein